MSKSKLGNRLLSALLALCMVFALLPMGVLAASPNGESVPIYERENIIPATEVHPAYQFTECQMDIIDYTQSHGSGADPNAAKTVTITAGNEFNPDKVRVTGAILEHSVGATKRYFTTITAGDVHRAVSNDYSINRWASIEIDTTESTNESIKMRGMDVYLVGFGKAAGNEINSHPMKAIESLTVNGNYVNVYLVGCNIGVVKQEAYNAYDSRVCNIRVNGVDSHIYADKDTNADDPGKAVCQVQIQGSLPAGAFYNPDYDTVGYGYLQQNAIGTPEELSSTVELSNVTIRKMSSSWPTNGFHDASFENGVLDKYTGVTLNKCVWGPYINNGVVSTALSKVVLNEFAQLMLIDTTPISSYGETEYDYDDVCAPVELNHRSTLTIHGENKSQVIDKGRNVLRLNDAKIGGRGYILVDATCNANTYTYLSPSGMYYYENHGPEGAHLRILMSGSSTIQTDGRGSGWTPDIMVDNQGTAIFQDDPSVAGIGSLTIGAEWADGGHAYCAAIGGTPSLNPLPHGNVTIRRGSLTVSSSYGGAGIGGSVNTPTIVYKVKEGGQAHALEWNGDPANLIKIYQNTSVGYLYYDTTDDQFNPYHGGYWLRKTGNTYEPVKKNDEGNWEVVIIPADYLLDGNGNKIVDEESSTPGFSRDGGVVTVSGGVLNASAFGAAAIGGAKGGNGGEFGILSGTVNAKTTGGGAAIGGGPVNWGKPVRTGIGFQTQHDWQNTSPTTWTDGIYIDRYMYSPSMGGGSGKVFIYGGIVNATADNPAYDESGRLYSEPVYYNEDGSVFDPKEYNTTTQEWEWKNYYTYTDKEYTLSFEDGVLTGRLPGYVIGSTCENANSYYENRTEILLVGGMMQSDGNPTLILQQNARVGNVGEVSASWDNFFRKQNPQGVMTQDALGRDPDPTDGYDNPLFDPSLISGACLILGIGWEDTVVTDGTTGQLISGSADYTFKPIQISENYTYRIRGQIEIPDLEYLKTTDGVYNFVLPAGTELDLLSGTVLTVPEHFAIMASDMSQFIVEEGSVVQGKGRWPGKPTQPESAPTTQQVRSLLEKIGNGSSSSGQGGTIVRTHLAIAETKDGLMVLSGNGVDAVQSQAEAIGLPIITIFSAGSDGFKGQTIEGVTTWKLNSRSPDTVISLIPNGALTATPGKHTTTNYAPDLIISDNGNGGVNITLQSVKLHTPEYTVYQPHQADDQITLVPETSKSPMAFKIEFEDDQVTNNDALFAVPSFSGSEFNLRSVAPLKNKCAVRYGGTLSFSAPFADFGNITIEELQLKYGDGVKLDGIAGEGSVDVPSIAGFPVSGGAKMKLNTFAPNRLVSLSVNLETPLFSGAFETSFKEVRGVILLDTLYAELAVDEGGIPLVPPTVIGYLQGGGLGISGLADTVGMDSFGAPPVRLNVAAKGSIVDVIEGWIRLSVGMDGFDLTMEDIEIADMEFIKEFGVSAKWDAGEREIHGKTYWGLSADMEQYMVIAVPATVTSSYGGEDDNLPMLFSATGTIGYGGFTG
ncbi:MAG: hypothetical protein IKS34_02190, partial [Clostridia bacterium]|nr:hypothetical protein [Clostridia bacterium]